jgi:hypothetical protein
MMVVNCKTTISSLHPYPLPITSLIQFFLGKHILSYVSLWKEINIYIYIYIYISYDIIYAGIYTARSSLPSSHLSFTLVPFSVHGLPARSSLPSSHLSFTLVPLSVHGLPARSSLSPSRTSPSPSFHSPFMRYPRAVFSPFLAPLPSTLFPPLLSRRS